MNNPFNISPQLLRRVAFAANSSDPWINWHQNLIHWADEVISIIIEAEKSIPPKSILDIGTGNSSPLFKLLKTFKDCHIDACDIDKNLLELGELLIQEKKIRNIKLLECNAEDLKYSTKEFDLIICMFSFMYFQNHKKVIDEIYRVLKEGCKAYIATWGEYNALFSLVKKELKWNLSYEYKEEVNPHSFSETQNIERVINTLDHVSTTVNKHRINLNWDGSAAQLWAFFKASNKAIENHLLQLSAIDREETELNIINEIEKLDRDTYLKIPVDIILTTIESNNITQ